MKNKRWDLCAHFECRNKTNSGKKEPCVEDRWCGIHSPEAEAQREQFLAEHGHELNDDPVRARRNDYVFPLLCVYKEIVVVEARGGEPRRVTMATELCGAEAARRFKGDRSLPRYPNRHGDPLCERHRIWANNLDAFPDEPGFIGCIAKSEAEEEAEGQMEENLAYLQAADQGTQVRICSEKLSNGKPCHRAVLKLAISVCHIHEASRNRARAKAKAKAAAKANDSLSIHDAVADLLLSVQHVRIRAEVGMKKRHLLLTAPMRFACTGGKPLVPAWRGQTVAHSITCLECIDIRDRVQPVPEPPPLLQIPLVAGTDIMGSNEVPYIASWVPPGKKMSQAALLREKRLSAQDAGFLMNQMKGEAPPIDPEMVAILEKRMSR